MLLRIALISHAAALSLSSTVSHPSFEGESVETVTCGSGVRYLWLVDNVLDNFVRQDYKGWMELVVIADGMNETDIGKLRHKVAMKTRPERPITVVELAKLPTGGDYPSGAGVKRMMGMRVARGDVYVNLDDDDFFGPGYVREIMSYFNTNKDKILMATPTLSARLQVDGSVSIGRTPANLYSWRQIEEMRQNKSQADAPATADNQAVRMDAVRPGKLDSKEPVDIDTVTNKTLACEYHWKKFQEEQLLVNCINDKFGEGALGMMLRKEYPMAVHVKLFWGGSLTMSHSRSYFPASFGGLMSMTKLQTEEYHTQLLHFIDFMKGTLGEASPEIPYDNQGFHWGPAFCGFWAGTMEPPVSKEQLDSIAPQLAEAGLTNLTDFLQGLLNAAKGPQKAKTPEAWRGDFKR